jgi:hypothetical protein
MEVTVQPAGTELRETVKRVKDEGHCFGFAASFVHQKEAFAEPKVSRRWIAHSTVRNLLIQLGLVQGLASKANCWRGIDEPRSVTTVHIDCREMP